MANNDIDKLYDHIRYRFGLRGSGANGYQFQFFFRREQRQVLSYLRHQPGPIVDVACGSGLMVEPMLAGDTAVVGVDFNAQACLDANQNGLPIIRGDGFRLPFADQSVGQVINSQFLNQQTKADTERFVREISRVLKPGGQLVLFWRHGQSLLHRNAAMVFQFVDRLRGAPKFPQYIHPMTELEEFAKQYGLQCREQAVTLPILAVDQVATNSWLARVFGASLVVVMEKPE